jgi:hypothetical protein
MTEFCPLNARALSDPGRATAPASTHAPDANSFLRDTVILVIVFSPSNDVMFGASRC